MAHRAPICISMSPFAVDAVPPSVADKNRATKNHPSLRCRAGPRAPAPPPGISAIIAKTQQHTLTLYGNVDIRQVQLAFNGSERIARMLVKEGEPVKQGQLLATLDTVRLAHNVDLQQAQVASQQQVVSRLVAGSRPEEISKAQADVEAARIDADNAESTLSAAEGTGRTAFRGEAAGGQCACGCRCGAGQISRAAGNAEAGPDGAAQGRHRGGQGHAAGQPGSAGSGAQGAGRCIAVCAGQRHHPGAHPRTGRHGIAAAPGLYAGAHRSRSGCAPMCRGRTSASSSRACAPR